MRTAENALELASIGAFFLMMAFWSGLSSGTPLV